AKPRYGGHELSTEAATAITTLPDANPPSVPEGLHCPLCQKAAKTDRGLRKHLGGTLAHGGHALPSAAAAAVAARAAADAGESGDRAGQETVLDTAPAVRQERVGIPK